jgi:hypothetical protein
VQGGVIIGQPTPGSQQLIASTHNGYTRRSIDACRSPVPRFLVTVDAEEDDGWAAMPSTTTRNAAFLPRFQRLCESFGLRPTYLTNYPMATSDEFIDFGRDLVARGAGEIGMHLHAWNTPPIVPITDNDARHHTYLIDYCLPVMRQKIVRMTACLADTFGIPILSHRAGRWAFDSRYAGLLLEEGYRIDCSVTPYMNWRRHPGAPSGQGGTDYTKYPELPYFLDAQDPSRVGSNGLLELPVTILPSWTTKDRSRGARLAGAIAAWLGQRPSSPFLWLRPNGRNRDEMIDLVERVRQEGRPYAQFMIHSSELMPGGSPYFRRADDIERLYEDLDALFTFVRGRFVGETLTEFATQAATGAD